MKVRLAAAALALALGACGSSPDADDPRKVTSDEARALDEAAEMVEATRPPVIAEPSPEATAASK